MLISKKSFEIMTRKLVSDDIDSKRFMYDLMADLITSFETHERIEKRINIDNFEDDDLINSGSFNDGKKSKNSKKNT